MYNWFTDPQSSYPVPLTVTDIRPTAGHKTDPDEAADYLKSQGVRMVFALDFTTNIFHDFAEYLYGNNMQEQQNWEPGKYFLSSLNFGGLANSDSFQVGLWGGTVWQSSALPLVHSPPNISF